MFSKNYRNRTVTFFFLSILLIYFISLASAQNMDLLLEKMKVHPKMESVLSHLEEEHGKGVATGRKFASERAIKIDDEDKITVMIILDKQIKCNPRGAVKCS